MKLEISVRDLQQVKKIDFAVDLAEKSLICITGKNGSGKTTLIKAVRNLISADTLARTSASRSFSASSEIRYKIDQINIVFQYNPKTKMLDSRDFVPNALRQKLFVELPIPHGERFNFFQKISEIDSALRSQVVLGRYSTPSELIAFLGSIYATDKFANLVEVRVKNVPYYAIVYDDKYYLREDYFSSGEYFLISLYRRIISGHMAIFIDEIDISLDAAAQVRLIEWLRKFKEVYNTTFIFTTHSLAMMRMMNTDELFHMEVGDDGSTTIERRSYGYIKSTLFGFKGWDKYILTEDDVLKDFLTHLIAYHCRPSYYQHKIIYIGGSSNTTDLMDRNRTEHFLSSSAQDVIVVLDGDQRTRVGMKPNVFCIPFDSVEKDLLSRCLKGEFWDTRKFRTLVEDHERLLAFTNKQRAGMRRPITALLYRALLFFVKNTRLRRRFSAANGDPAKEKDFKQAGKRLFKHLIKSKTYTRQDIFEFLIKKNSTEMRKLSSQIERFLCL